MFKRIIAVLLTLFVCGASQTHAQWYAGVDFMVPTRADNARAVFQRNQGIAPPVVGNLALLNDDSIELDFTGAGRVVFGNRSGEFGFDASYLATDKWQDTASLFSPTGLLASPFSTPGAAPVLGLDNNTSAIVDYTTQLQTAEFNFTQRIYSCPNGDASFLFGVRYMTIEESLLYSSVNAVTPHSLLTTTDNQIIGPQLGTILETPLVGGTASFIFKAGLGLNSAEKTTLFDGTFGAGEEQTATFMSEIGVDCMFHPTQFLAIRVGYHLVAANQVALATDNFENNLSVLGSGTANVQTNAGVVYHSPYIGLVFSY